MIKKMTHNTQQEDFIAFRSPLKFHSKFLLVGMLFFMSLALTKQKIARSPSSLPETHSPTHQNHRSHGPRATGLWNGGKQRAPVSLTSDDIRYLDIEIRHKPEIQLLIEEPFTNLTVTARLIGPIRWETKGSEAQSLEVPTSGEGEKLLPISIPEIHFAEEGEGIIAFDIQYFSLGQSRTIHLPKSYLSSKASVTGRLIPKGRNIEGREKNAAGNTAIIQLPTKPQG